MGRSLGGLRLDDFVGLIRRIGVDRVMLGSDCPWYGPARTLQRVLELPGLSVREQQAIVGGDARRLVRL